MVTWKHKWTHYLGVVSSLLCLIHCLAIPVVLVVFPAFTSFNLSSIDPFWEHVFVVLAIISVFTIIQIHKTHNKFSVALPLAFLGVLILTISLFLGHDTASYLLPVGSMCILFGHIMNLKLCNEHKRCSHHKLMA